MSKKVKQYIESHWGVYLWQTIVSLGFVGFLRIFGSKDFFALVTVAATVILSLGVVETLNIAHRRHGKKGVALNIFVAGLSILAALVLFFTATQPAVLHLAVISIYVLIRAVLEIFIGFTSIKDKTNKFIWVSCGIVSTIFAFAIFNSGYLGTDAFYEFFSGYLACFAFCNFVYTTRLLRA